MNQNFTNFPDVVLTCLSDFAGSMGLSLVASQDGSFSFNFEGDLKLTFDYPVVANQENKKTHGADIVLMSMTDQSTRLVHQSALEQHFAVCGYDETLQVPIVSGLTADMNPMFVACYEVETFNLQTLETTLDYCLAAFER